MNDDPDSWAIIRAPIYLFAFFCVFYDFYMRCEIKLLLYAHIERGRAGPPNLSPPFFARLLSTGIWLGNDNFFFSDLSDSSFWSHFLSYHMPEVEEEEEERDLEASSPASRNDEGGDFKNTRRRRRGLFLSPPRLGSLWGRRCRPIRRAVEAFRARRLPSSSSFVLFFHRSPGG